MLKRIALPFKQANTHEEKKKSTACQKGDIRSHIGESGSVQSKLTGGLYEMRRGQ